MAVRSVPSQPSRWRVLALVCRTCSEGNTVAIRSFLSAPGDALQFDEVMAAARWDRDDDPRACHCASNEEPPELADLAWDVRRACAAMRSADDPRSFERRAARTIRL